MKTANSESKSSPRKMVVFSLGTRGDVEPFLAVAQILKQQGCEVICAFPEQFRQLTEQAGFSFSGLSKQFLELMEGKAGPIALGGKGFFRRLVAIIRMFVKSESVQKILVDQQYRLLEQEKPDLVIYSGICAYPVIWGMANPGNTVMISPVPCFIHPVKTRAMQGIRGNLGPFLNKLTYQTFNWILFGNIYRTTKRYHKLFPQVKFSPWSIKSNFLRNEKLWYSVSPTLFPRPNYWPKQAEVIGHLEREQKHEWTPEPSLNDFLEKYPKILMITFGSMVNPAPEEKTRIILRILAKHRIPTIINTSFGGLQRPANFPEQIYFVEDIPYDWVFPKVYAVIHHGGSGTTHTALKYDCASMIVPHILDQFFWHDVIVKLGVGPKGLPIYKLTEKKLERRILDLYTNDNYHKKAGLIQTRMADEDAENRLSNLLL